MNMSEKNEELETTMADDSAAEMVRRAGGGFSPEQREEDSLANSVPVPD
jgi:hypothetical protein